MILETVVVVCMLLVLYGVQEFVLFSVKRNEDLPNSNSLNRKS